MSRPPELTGEQVLAWRLRRHLLEPRGDVDAVTVVRRLCGVQAQVLSAAAAAVAVRQAAPDGEAVTRALRDRALVRTWAARGTLHLLTADEAGAHLALAGAARAWEKPSWQRAFVSLADLRRLADAVAAALAGRELTREELVAEVAARTGDPALAEQVRSGWGAVLKPLAWQGLLCQGSGQGSRVTFVRPEDALPGWRGLPDVEEAVRCVVPAYLAAHGPAGPTEFDRWLTRGATPRRLVRGWFDGLRGELTDVTVDGRPAQVRACDVEELTGTRPSAAVRLLPAFDQWVLGPGTGDPLVVPPARRSAVSRAAGWISPVVVVGGRVAGTWEVRDADLHVTVFGEATPLAQDPLAEEAARLAALVGRDLRLTVAAV